MPRIVFVALFMAVAFVPFIFFAPRGQTTRPSSTYSEEHRSSHYRRRHGSSFFFFSTGPRGYRGSSYSSKRGKSYRSGGFQGGGMRSGK